MTFTSELTGEYCFYEVKYTSTAPASRGTLAMECPVRTQTVSRVQIANPLPSDVALKATVVGSKQVGGDLKLAAEQPVMNLLTKGKDFP